MLLRVQDSVTWEVSDKDEKYFPQISSSLHLQMEMLFSSGRS